MKKTNVFLAHHDLRRQAELLQEVSVDVDPATIDLVQVAIAEDIQLFKILHNQETRDQLLQQFLGGEIEISAGTIEAARLLANILLED